MKKLFATVSAAILLTACNEKGNDIQVTAPNSISVYPESGIVIETIEADKNCKGCNQERSYNMVDYRQQQLTKSFAIYASPHRQDAMSSIQVTIPFSEIKDSTDARKVRELQQYLPTAP